MPKKHASPHDENMSPCAVDGCYAPGEHRAPKPYGKRDEPDYMFLCQPHAREFNEKWDYFRGWSQEQIERFRHESLTGHRPTWRTAGRIGTRELRAELERFLSGDATVYNGAYQRPMPPKERKAWKILELDAPLDEAGLKSHYKKLVKRTHPDATGGSKEAEERFKEITESYKFLMQTFKKPL